MEETRKKLWYKYKYLEIHLSLCHYGDDKYASMLQLLKKKE